MNDFITIVSGLPRSGTSMMMKMLESGGLEVAVDNIRKADEDNPKGYYELEKVKKIQEDSSWLPDTLGKVFKMIAMLLTDLPAGHQYRIVFMERNMEECLASQRKMLIRRGHDPDKIDDNMMAELFRKHLAHVKKWLASQSHIETLYVNYNELLVDPESETLKINSFLGDQLNVEQMSSVIDSSLYRNRQPGEG